MPKCSRCPIRKECNKLGMISKVKGKDGKMETRKVCPILWTIRMLLRVTKDETSKQSKD